MATVSQQYLKDKNGNKFSPITSTKSVYKGTEDLETVLDKIEYYQPGETVTYAKYITLGNFVGPSLLYLSFNLSKSLEKVKNKIFITLPSCHLYTTSGELMRDCSSSNYSFPTSAADYSPSQNQIFTYMQFNIQINPNWSTQRLAWVECNGISFKF